jgi:hypothetical protein
LLELESAVDGHFLAVRATEGLGPAELARVALHLEVGVAFAAAEAELLGVVAHKGDAFGGVAGAGAEVACFDPVDQVSWSRLDRFM